VGGRGATRHHGWAWRAGLAGACALLLLAWLSQVSRPGRRVEGCLEGCASLDERKPGPLRYLSFNILHEFPRFTHLEARLALIADGIERLDADIICLQEVPWTTRTGSAARWLAERTGMNYAYLRANGNRFAILFEEGEALLSRFPLREPSHTELLPRAGAFEHRVALAATAETPWGDLQVICTHLTNGDQTLNQAQFRSLSALGGALTPPVVISGDLNAQPHELDIGQLGWVDTYRALHPDEDGLTCCVEALTAAPDEPLEERIDYVFLRPGPGAERVASSRIVFDRPAATANGWLWASDHLGLLVMLAP